MFKIPTELSEVFKISVNILSHVINNTTVIVNDVNNGVLGCRTFLVDSDTCELLFVRLVAAEPHGFLKFADITCNIT